MAKIITKKGLKSYWPLYAFVLPSAFLIALLSYFPTVSALFHAFYRWNASTINEFIGLGNFHHLLGWSPWLWIVMAAWIALMMMTMTGKPAKFHRVVPWCLLGLVGVAWLMIFVGAKGAEGREVLNMVAADAAKWMPRAFILTAIGVIGHAVFRSRASSGIRGFFVLMGFLWFLYQSMMLTGDKILWAGFRVTFILVVANLVKMIPSIATAVVIHRLKSERFQYLYRVLFVIPMIIPGMVYLLLWKFFYDPTQGILNRILDGTGMMNLLVWLDGVLDWGVFVAGQAPSWLGETKLIIPALIFWGFPWVGVVGVLIYLAGLQSIPLDVYEAADLDGVNWFQKFTKIEFPLILTQVRINLIMMILGTLQGYGQILIILGDTGGPDGVAMVPGLYMFRNAFVEGYAGRGCAIGLVIFVFILILTEINNRYVRVKK